MQGFRGVVDPRMSAAVSFFPDMESQVPAAAGLRRRSTDCRWPVFGRLAGNLALLAVFRSQRGVAVIDLTDTMAQRYAAIVMALKQEGAPIPTNDIWIAAATLENGGRIIAYDHHFEAVAGVMAEAP